MCVCLATHMLLAAVLLTDNAREEPTSPSQSTHFLCGWTHSLSHTWTCTTLLTAQPRAVPDGAVHHDVAHALGDLAAAAVDDHGEGLRGEFHLFTCYMCMCMCVVCDGDGWWWWMLKRLRQGGVTSIDPSRMHTCHHINTHTHTQTLIPVGAISSSYNTRRPLCVPVVRVVNHTRLGSAVSARKSWAL